MEGYFEDLKQQHPDVDPDEGQEAVNGTEYDNITGIHDESGAVYPKSISYFQVYLDKEADSLVGLLLVNDGRGLNTRIEVFKIGKVGDFRNVEKKEIVLL